MQRLAGSLCSSSATMQCILYLGSVDVYSMFVFLYIAMWYYA